MIPGRLRHAERKAAAPAISSALILPLSLHASLARADTALALRASPQPSPCGRRDPRRGPPVLPLRAEQPRQVATVAISLVLSLSPAQGSPRRRGQGGLQERWGWGRVGRSSPVTAGAMAWPWAPGEGVGATRSRGFRHVQSGRRCSRARLTVSFLSLRSAAVQWNPPKRRPVERDPGRGKLISPLWPPVGCRGTRRPPDPERSRCSPRAPAAAPETLVCAGSGLSQVTHAPKTRDALPGRRVRFSHCLSAQVLDELRRQELHARTPPHWPPDPHR